MQASRVAPPASNRKSRALAGLLAAVLLFAAAEPARSQNVEASSATGARPNAPPLFASDEPLRIAITTDLGAVLNDRAEESTERPGLVAVRSANGDDLVLEVQLRTRGYFRLLMLGCDVPPLRLNFKKKQVAGTVFDGQDKLKLVTHCVTRSRRFQQYVMQEYLIYRAYALLTEDSFQTRLAEITYLDSRGRRDPITGYGFLIEDDELMAERNGARLIESEATIHPEATHRESMTRLTVFQYMIGNTDWTVTTRHNVELIFDSTARAIIAVPYDFDWAGLIDAPYATPDPQLDIRSVRDRKFMGFCRTEDEFAAAFEQFDRQREAILDLFRDFPLLDPDVSERSVDYLTEFFETIKTPRRVEREFLAACLR